jgi:hypothetical protein
MTSFETTGHVAVRVTLGGGEVNVQAVAGTGVDVELVPLRDNDATRQAIDEAKVELSDRGGGHELTIQIAKRSGSLLGRGAKVGVRARCPLGSDLDLRAGSADLEAVGALGAVRVKTASGDISLEDAERLQIDTASGDVRVRDIVGSAELRSASGDVSIRRCGGLVTANVVSGDLSISEAAAGLALTTVSGDAHVQAAGGGRMRVQAVSGDVHLGIKPGERLYIDATSVSGTMSSELDVHDAPPADATEEVRELRIRTVSGDVRIVRAVGVGA